MRWTTWSLVAAFWLALAGEASAQQAPGTTELEVLYPRPLVHVYADLSFTVDQNAGICPGEQWFRAVIGARLGVDAFMPNPRGVYVGRVRAAVSRVPGGFVASYTWEDAEGGTSSSQRFVRKGATRYHCQDAIESVAADLALRFRVIELRLGARYARPTAPLEATAKPCPTVPPCPESPYSVWPREPPLRGPAPEPPKPERWPVAVRLGAAVWPEIIARGFMSLGLSAEAGVRYRFLSLGAEVHGDPPLGSESFGNRSVSFARASGVFRLCALYGFFAGCGVGDVGRIIFLNRVAGLPPSAFYGAAGVQVGLELPIAPPRLFLSIAADLLAPLHPVNHVWMGRSVFPVAGPNGGLGFGLRVELPL